MTTPEKLRAYIYVNADVAATAEHLAVTLERDYHVVSAHFNMTATNLELGEIAKALNIHTMFDAENERYYMHVQHRNNTVQITGPHSPIKSK